MQQKTKKRLIITCIIIAIISIMVGGVAYASKWAFHDIQRINGQKYLNELTSPNRTYTVTAYLNNGGATTSFAVLGRLKNNKNGKMKNIYWQYRCDKADMEWLNDETIKINGVELNVKNEIYDYRDKLNLINHNLSTIYRKQNSINKATFIFSYIILKFINMVYNIKR